MPDDALHSPAARPYRADAERSYVLPPNYYIDPAVYEREKRDIFYNNAARFLRIDEAKEFHGAVSKSTPPNRRIQPPSRAPYRCAERVRLHAARG